MKFGTSLIISFLAIIALVAEVFLFGFFGMALELGGLSTGLGFASIFMSLLIITAATSVLAPVCAVTEMVANRFVDSSKLKHKKWFIKDIGTTLLAISLSLILIFSIVFVAYSMITLREFESKTEPSKSRFEIIVEEKVAKRDYLKNVKIEYFEVTEGYLTYENPKYASPKPAIKGKIKNYGDKSLDEVEITIYFLDANGQRIAETTYHPVNVHSFMGDDSPLKPNYVREFGYVVEDYTPSNWAKKAEAEITDIEFSD